MSNGKTSAVGMMLAACLALPASSTWAGFAVTTTPTAVVVNGTPLDRYDIVAINTGGDTGTQVKGLEYYYSGTRAFFEVEDETDATGEGGPDHIPDTANLISSTLTRVRVANSLASNVYVGASPDFGPTQWNPYMVGLKQFHGAIANTGQTQATGAGYQIARIFTLRGGYGAFSGNLGGDMGSKVPFGLYYGPSASPGPIPVLGSNLEEPIVAVFGSDAAAGAPFSVTIDVNVPDPNGTYTLATTPIPGINDVSVTSSGIGSTARQYTITGTVDYSRLYNPTIVPFGFGGSAFAPMDAFTVFAMPEPASLSLLGLLLATGRRRGA
jgi:hypothetical protein